LLWHLGMTTPVRYLEGGPVAEDYARGDVGRVVDKLRRVAEGFEFRLWFDGVEVRKPLLLPTPYVERTETEESDVGVIDDYHAWPIRVSGNASNGNPVKAEGYLFFQPYRVIPVEMRGLLPRVDGVGVGATLDNTFMSDLKAESPLFRVQVSGELYVVRGLTEALDLDRSGFLQVDTEFRFLLSKVGEIIYDFVREAARIRRQRQRRLRQQRETESFDERVTTLKQMLADAGIRLEVVPSSQVSLNRFGSVDYQSRSSYPTDRPKLVIEYRDSKARVELSVEDPSWIAIVSLVDEILASCSDAATLRRRFAVGLKAIETRRNAT